jgi:predicted DNA-binding transcriptional regulator AlpA
MTINKIEEKLGISKSTFYDLNKKNHKRRNLAKLLSAIDEKEVDRLIKLAEDEERLQPIYSTKTRKIKLQKEWFVNDLFWSSPNNIPIKIENIITVYMNRSNQIDTDKLCKFFGIDRMYKTVNKYIENSHNKKEAIRQISYYESKISKKSYAYTKDELENNFYKQPKQRIVDYYCKKYGKAKVLNMISDSSFTVKFQVKKMISFYEQNNY